MSTIAIVHFALVKHFVKIQITPIKMDPEKQKNDNKST